MTTQPTTLFTQFLDTFAVFTESTRRVAAMDAEVQADVDAIIDAQKADYLAALAAEKEARDALIAWAQQHPEWFNGKKSLTTPHGKIEKRTTRSLEIPNEAATTRLILAEMEPKIRITEILGAAAEFLHIEIKPNREALEKLNDAELKNLGIERRVTESITPKPRKLDLGKAIEAKNESGEE